MILNDPKCYFSHKFDADLMFDGVCLFIFMPEKTENSMKPPSNLDQRNQLWMCQAPKHQLTESADTARANIRLLKYKKLEFPRPQLQSPHNDISVPACKHVIQKNLGEEMASLYIDRLQQLSEDLRSAFGHVIGLK